MRRRRPGRAGPGAAGMPEETVQRAAGLRAPADEHDPEPGRAARHRGCRSARPGAPLCTEFHQDPGGARGRL